MTSTAESRSLRALIVDDSQVHAAAIISGLEHTGWTVEPHRVTTEEGLREAAIAFAPDVVLCAPALEQFDVSSALAILAEVRPGLPLIVVGQDLDAHTAADALRAGAEDIVHLRGEDRLARVVESAVSVRSRLNTLSPRQRQVLALVARGNTSPEIATRLNISVKTVETHRGELMKRIGARDVVGLVHYALRVGLVPNAA